VAPGAGSSSHKFVFSKDSLKGNSAGSFKFGKDLSDCPAFANGLLKAYHEYKINQVLLEFITEASSTAAGSIAHELDPHCELESLASTINKFSITKTGRRTFAAKAINGIEWHSAKDNQFHILYKGNGSGDPAGSFRITFWVNVQNPK
jgi:hypothetical protein